LDKTLVGPTQKEAHDKCNHKSLDDGIPGINNQRKVKLTQIMESTDQTSYN
jgi:hypothetical protein